MFSRDKKPRFVIGIALLVCFVLIYLAVSHIRFDNGTGEASQAYQTHRSIGLSTTETFRLSNFERTLTDLRMFGGGEVIFQGGEGFVHFQVRKDGGLVVMVPVSASIPRILPATWIRFFMNGKYKYHHIRLPHKERKQLEQMARLQNATEKKVAHRGATPHTFIEVELGSDLSNASELAESILTEIFHVGSGEVIIYAGDSQKFRWM